MYNCNSSVVFACVGHHGGRTVWTSGAQLRDGTFILPRADENDAA
jgi:hypothetical protein